MKISGVLPLRNAIKLGYPFGLAIGSLRTLCDEVVVLVDPSSEDGTFDAVRKLCSMNVVDKVVESIWNMDNHDGHRNCEISVQTQRACDAATGDWVFSLQADEVLHENNIGAIRYAAQVADDSGASGVEMQRLYFYGSLAQYREDWTIWLLRFFKRGRWKPDVDGAMRFDPIEPREQRIRIPQHIYHYSRVGDPRQIAERVRNLDLFFHSPERVAAGEVPPYDFSSTRKLDTYVIGHAAEAADARLLSFRVEDHPRAVREFFHAT